MAPVTHADTGRCVLPRGSTGALLHPGRRKPGRRPADPTPSVLIAHRGPACASTAGAPAAPAAVGTVNRDRAGTSPVPRTERWPPRIRARTAPVCSLSAASPTAPVPEQDPPAGTPTGPQAWFCRRPAGPRAGVHVVGPAAEMIRRAACSPVVIDALVVLYEKWSPASWIGDRGSRLPVKRARSR